MPTLSSTALKCCAAALTCCVLLLTLQSCTHKPPVESKEPVAVAPPPPPPPTPFEEGTLDFPPLTWWSSVVVGQVAHLKEIARPNAEQTLTFGLLLPMVPGLVVVPDKQASGDFTGVPRHLFSVIPESEADAMVASGDVGIDVLALPIDGSKRPTEEQVGAVLTTFLTVTLAAASGTDAIMGAEKTVVPAWFRQVQANDTQLQRIVEAKPKIPGVALAFDWPQDNPSRQWALAVQAGDFVYLLLAAPGNQPEAVQAFLSGLAAR